MLFGAAFFALLLSMAVAAPRGGKVVRPRVQRPVHRPDQRHPMSYNPFLQSRHPLTQGFLCDWCVVSVQDGQEAVRANMDQINELLSRASDLCAYCPVEDQCREVFQTDIPAAINEYLNMSPNEVCTDAGLCDANATIQGMVMNSLRGDFARDRVIKRMLMRARVMQQKMIRIILGEDYMCTSCLDIVQIAREALLNNETEYEIVEFLTPLCSYLPDVFQAECTEFVQGLPDLMQMVANDLLADSVCTDVGLCNQTKSTTDVSDTLSRLGLPGVLPVMPGGRQNQWQFPGSKPGRKDPFQFPGQGGRNPMRIPGPGRTPYGYPSRPRDNQPRPDGGRQPRPNGRQPSRPNGRNPFDLPTIPEQQDPVWTPIKWPGSSKPQKPQDPAIGGDAINVPDIDLTEYLGKIGGIMDSLPDVPSLPGMPDIQIPGVDLSTIPGQRRGKKGGHKRRQRSIADWTDTDFLGLPKDTTHEYLPEAIPDDGLTILENGADENCELCKVAISAGAAWVEENTPRIKKMLFKMILPVCKVFPSPMKEDCSSDMRELVQTAFERLAELMQQPEEICTDIGVCVVDVAAEEEVITPTTERVATEAVVEAEPETEEEAGGNWPIPYLNRFKDFKIPKDIKF